MTSSPDQVRVRREALAALHQAQARSKQVLVGLDGFIDEIIHVVDQRYDFERYSRLTTMSSYADRLARAAGKSCNVEWVVKNVKLGGNGPIMAACIGELGNQVDYVGAVGWPDVDPVFRPLTKYGEVVTLARPGHTDAVEFDDGKVMHGKIETMRDVRWARLLEKLGGEAGLRQRLTVTDLLALTNWTMIPFSNEIYENLFALAGQIEPAKRPGFFFDLADPEKRTREDLVGICRLLGRAAQEGQTILLGLNYKESQQVATVLSLTCPSGDSPESIRDLAARIQHTTGITEVIIHPRHRAAVATRAGAWSMEGPFTPHPKLSTGAGDHFNAGYCHARLQDLSPELALAVGTATSGFYVRNGKSPSNGELEAFIDRWVRGELPE